jgi:Na+-translocating ferredoxin:NAD+ oxidoreductase RnfA subunit
MEFKFSRTLSLATHFLFKFSLIVAWPKTRYIMEGVIIEIVRIIACILIIEREVGP